MGQGKFDTFNSLGSAQYIKKREPNSSLILL